MDQVSKNILNLDKISKQDRSNTVKNVSDTLLLLQGDVIPEEISILKQIGLDNHIQKAETAKRNINRFTAFETKYGRNVYAGSQIKKYCESNGFKMIRVDRFKHEVPLEVGKAIINFNEEQSYEHEKSEEKTVKKSRIDLQPQHFFLLVSIQAVNGAPVKSATLFYREEYSHDFYETASEKDMFVEVFSWGIPGTDKNLFWYYVKATDYLIIFPVIFLVIGLLCLILGENSHGILLFLSICTLIAILTSKKPSFFKWN
jgi:hypothetical protein